MTLCLIVLSLSSCYKNLDKHLPRNSGTWHIVSYTITEYENDKQISENVHMNYGNMVFEKKGKGSITYATQETADFTWDFDSDEEQITIVEGGFSITYNIGWTGADGQLWTALVGNKKDKATEYSLNLEKVK